jgi:hypothetical protein
LEKEEVKEHKRKLYGKVYNKTIGVVKLCHFYRAWECHEMKCTKRGDKKNDSGLIKVWQNHENYEKLVVEHSPECHRKD